VASGPMDESAFRKMARSKSRDGETIVVRQVANAKSEIATPRSGLKRLLTPPWAKGEARGVLSRLSAPDHLRTNADRHSTHLLVVI
jgi:hypothetical protein